MPAVPKRSPRTPSRARRLARPASLIPGRLGRVLLAEVFLVVGVMTLTVGCDPTAGPDPVETATGPSATVETTPPPEDPGPRPRRLPSDDLDVNAPPRFTGISQLIAGESSITLRWEHALDRDTAREQIRYRVYLSEERQDEAKYARPPHFETPPGNTGTRIEGLQNGVPVYVVVRAVDAEGNEDDNELEWSAIPNPVLYVQPGSPPGGDGRTRDAPLPDLTAAISASISWLEGANIYLTEGEYAEPTTLLFGGVMVYGGFAPGFPEPVSEPRKHPTLIRHANPVALSDASLSQFILAPGELVCGIDGVDLDGGGQLARGVSGEDCEFRVSNCKIRSFQHRGVSIKSDTKPNSVAIGEIARCWIYDTSNGSAIDMEGTLDVAITGCGLFHNRKHGIEIEGLTATPEEKSRVTVEGCRVYENRDIGLLVKCRALPEDASHGSRIRIKVRSCEIANNSDSGMSIDVGYPDGIDINFRLRVEQCRIEGNGRLPTAEELAAMRDETIPASKRPRLDFAGIHIDGDARGHYQLTRNQILGNRGHGVHLTGDGPASFYQIQSCAILANEKSGVQLDSGTNGELEVSGHLSIDHTHIAGNGGFAFFGWGDETWMRVEDSMVHGNSAPAFADRVDYVVAGELQVAGPDDDPANPRIVVAEGEPWLETLPRRIIIQPNLRPGEPPDLSELEPGTVIEWLDDGFARRVVAGTEGAEKTLACDDPEAPPALALETGVPFLAIWEERPGVALDALVIEDYRAPDGSILLAVSNPDERDVDSDWGGSTPMGGFFGGTPGIDRGGPPPPRGLELSWIDPAPGMHVSELRFELQFTGTESLPDHFRVVLKVDGREIPAERIEVSVDDDEPMRLVVRSDVPVPIGSTLRLELPPWPARSGERRQVLDHLFEFEAAAPLDPEEGVRELPATAELLLPGGSPLRVSLDGVPTRRMRARLICISPPGGVEVVGDPAREGRDEVELHRWRMRVVDRRTGETLVLPGEGARPVEVRGTEPSDGDLHLTIPPLPLDGGYDLVITPPRESFFDASAILTVTESIR